MWDRQNSIIRRTAHVVPAADGTQDCFAGINLGTVPSARLVMSAQPTNADTIGIGGKTFTFVTALGAAGATVQVFIGASAAATLGSLVKAINGTAAPAEWTESTTPFAVAVLADAVGTSLRIRNATARGGLAKAGVSPSVVLAEAITAAADIWTNTNMTETGKSPADCNEAWGMFAITAQMVTALTAGASVAIELPFAIGPFDFDILASTGAKKQGTIITDQVTVSGSTLLITYAGATHIVAGDQFVYWAST